MRGWLLDLLLVCSTLPFSKALPWEKLMSASILTYHCFSFFELRPMPHARHALLNLSILYILHKGTKTMDTFKIQISIRTICLHLDDSISFQNLYQIKLNLFYDFRLYNIFAPLNVSSQKTIYKTSRPSDKEKKNKECSGQADHLHQNITGTSWHHRLVWTRIGIFLGLADSSYRPRFELY